MLLSITWDADPEIFRLGNFAIRWYSFFFALSFFMAYIIMHWIFTKENVSVKIMDQLTTYMILGPVIGARLGHVLFYQPALYLAHPLNIFKIWQGGLSSHGAGLGIIVALIIFSKQRKMSFLWLIDRLVIVMSLTGALIRIGNLMNSEIFGLPTSLPWGFIFLRSGLPAAAMVPRHPTQIYESLSCFIIFLVLLRLYRQNNGKPAPGLLFGLFMLLMPGIRFIIEFIKMPQVNFEQNLPINMGQILSIPMILTGIYFIYRSYRVCPDN